MASLSAGEILTRDGAAWEFYAAFVDVHIENDLFAFTTAPNRLGIIRRGYPYPASGIHLGFNKSGSLKIVKGSKIKDEDPPDEMNVPILADSSYEPTKRIVTFTIPTSGRKEVVDLLDDPGPTSKINSRGGGKFEVDPHNLVLLFRNVNKDDEFMGLIHWSCGIEAGDETFPAEGPQEIECVFHCYAGIDPLDPTCYRKGGTAVWRRIWFNWAGVLTDFTDMEDPKPIDGSGGGSGGSGGGGSEGGSEDNYEDTPGLDMANML